MEKKKKESVTESGPWHWMGPSMGPLCHSVKKKKWGFPSGSAGKESVCNAGDTGDVGSSPGLGGSPGEGNPLQDSCRKNPMDSGAWWITAQSVTKN